MQKLLGAVLVTMALVATSCGGSAEVPEQTAAVRSPTEQALELVDQLGSDNAASDALIIAMDRGYSASQILDAIARTDLEADGTINDQEPAGPPLNLVLYSLDGQDEDALAPQTGLSDEGEVRLASFSQARQTPIEQMRANTSWRDGVGKSATEFIVLLMQQLFTGKDIVEMLIFGHDGSEPHPDDDNQSLCVRVVDEIYCPLGERFPAQPEPDRADTTAGGVEADDLQDSAQADSDSTVGIDALYTGSASASAIAAATSASYEWQSVTFEGRVEGDTVALSLTTTLFIWWRGGDSDGEYTGDQNCGGTIVETLTGSGPAGSPTRIDLFAASSELVSTKGALCEGDEPERNLHAVGDPVGYFEGQANGLGFAGDFNSRPAVFVTTAITLEG